MDVAIRAVNWLWAFRLSRGSAAWRDDDIIRLDKSLWQHGWHIYANLENRGTVVNNHFLADLVGLIYIGALCPEFRQATDWLNYAHRSLCEEARRQVLDDGGSAEGSIAYHRLATELLLSPLLLCRINGVEIPNDVLAIIEKMLEFTLAYTFPDGTVPTIGDADNGRLHRLAVWHDPGREWQDHRYLLAIGAYLFDREDFAAAAGDQWQEAFWLIGDEAIRRSCVAVGAQSDLTSSAFPSTGVYILKDHDTCLLASTGGSPRTLAHVHGHNDLLSFEFFADNVHWIVDPGTFSYTGDYAMRHQFRSSLAHSNLTVDRQEQNLIDPRYPFTVSRRTHAEVQTWRSNTTIVELEATSPCPDDIRHTRRFSHAHNQQDWMIDDLVEGCGVHEVVIRFRLAPGVTVELSPMPSGCRAELHSAGRALEMLASWPNDTEGRGTILRDVPVSPSYGVRIPASVLEISVGCVLPITIHAILRKIHTDS